MPHYTDKTPENRNRSVARSLVQKKENKTGLPDPLKSGVENLSGLSLDEVKVHYHSPKPAQLNALAFAQGTDIHVGAGQEKHLPHEAWHVAQQMQGRVNPTTQMGGVPVNDDKGLEDEAGRMGNKALQCKQEPSLNTEPARSSGLSSSMPVSQLIVRQNEETKKWESDVTNTSYDTKEDAEAAEAALLKADELWPAIKYKMLQYEAPQSYEEQFEEEQPEKVESKAERSEEDDIHDNYVKEASYYDEANTEATFPILDRKDAHGLTRMANKIGWLIMDKMPNAIILVAGASPEIIAALIAELFPKIPQVIVAMSDVKEKHATGSPDPAIVKYVGSSMGKHAADNSPVVILDAADTGSSLILLKKALLALNPSRKIFPLAINTNENKNAFDYTISTLRTKLDDSSVQKAKARFNFQIYKAIFPRLIGKTPIEDIIAGRILTTPLGDSKKERHLRAAARAILKVHDSTNLEPDFGTSFTSGYPEERKSLIAERKKAMEKK